VCLSCDGHRLEATWVKTGYVAGKAGVQQREGSGACASACANSSTTPPPGTQAITTEMLFPVPPSGLSFVVRTFGKACSDGAPVASCLSVSADPRTGWTAQVPLPPSL
jgi:hypothetical protein